MSGNKKYFINCVNTDQERQTVDCSFIYSSYLQVFLSQYIIWSQLQKQTNNQKQIMERKVESVREGTLRRRMKKTHTIWKYTWEEWKEFLTEEGQGRGINNRKDSWNSHCNNIILYSSIYTCIHTCKVT